MKLLIFLATLLGSHALLASDAFILKISDEGDTLTLCDGSSWHVVSTDSALERSQRYTLSPGKLNDTRDYEVTLTLDSGEDVKLIMLAPPPFHSYHSTWIDSFADTEPALWIKRGDGKRLKFGFEGSFVNWQPLDFIALAKTQSRFSSNKFFLINLTRKESVAGNIIEGDL